MCIERNILILGITDNPAASIHHIYIDAANNRKLISIAREFGYRRFQRARCDIL